MQKVTQCGEGRRDGYSELDTITVMTTKPRRMRYGGKLIYADGSQRIKVASKNFTRGNHFGDLRIDETKKRI
jgi:hypothetical protein